VVVGGGRAVPKTSAALVPEKNGTPMLPDVPVLKPAKKRIPVLLPADPDSVPLAIRFPKGIGSVETRVSRGTANSIAKSLISGFLVVVGFMVAMMFRIKPPRA